MRNLIRRAYCYCLDESVTAGTLTRWLRRVYQERTNKPSRVGNIAMLHAGRCGSSVLADMLNQHPDVKWANEPFEAMKPAYRRLRNDRRAWHVIADRMYRQRTPFFGFDSKYLPEQHLRPQMANKSPEEYVALLTELGFAHYILLGRRNHLRRAASIAVGRKSQQWNTTDSPALLRTTVHLDARRFVSYGTVTPLFDFFRRLDETHAALKRLLARRQLLELEYESDIESDPRIGYEKTCRFLGIQPHPVRVRLQKINVQPLGELIENFDELCRLFQGTEYAWMLNE